MNEWVQEATGGSVVLALPLAILAGLASFFSPCVLPLLPGYLSFATGLSSAELLAGQRNRRVLAGTLGFVAGLTMVFVATGAMTGWLGSVLLDWHRGLSIVAGAAAIVLGLMFAGWIPANASWRVTVLPRLGVAASPLLGMVFALGWTPCIGPALAVVLSLALNEATAGRGSVLAVAYALGLGLPFAVAGSAFDRLSGTLDWARRHHRAVQQVGGTAMVVAGVLLISGLWDLLMAWLVSWTSGFPALI